MRTSWYGLYRIKWLRVAGFLALFAFLLWHPVTRRIIWVILPIGTKPDDLIFIAIASAIVVISIIAARGVVHRNLLFRFFMSMFFDVKKKNEELWDTDDRNPHSVNRFHDQ